MSSQKRRRRDYRLARKTQFVRPEPGFSLYEGRTRGKRPRYTYSDEEDGGSDALSTRQPNRQSGLSTPAESSGPTFTASGRQVRSRHGGTYGETVLSGQQEATESSKIGGLDGAKDDQDEDEDEPVSRGRPRRAAQQNRVKAKPRSRKHTEGYDSLGSMDDESDATSSGNEWDGGDEDEPDDHVDDDDEDEDVDMSDNSEEQEYPRQTLVVSLRYTKSRPSPPSQDTRNGPAISEDHSNPPMTTGNSNGPSKDAYSTDSLNELSNDAPTQDAAPTQYSRPIQQAAPLHHAAPAQHAAPIDPQSQVVHSGSSTRIAPEKDHTSLNPNHSVSQPEERPATTVSWPRPETDVVALNGTQM